LRQALWDAGECLNVIISQRNIEIREKCLENDVLKQYQLVSILKESGRK
jgi:hypothetical protein